MEGKLNEVGTRERRAVTFYGSFVPNDGSAIDNALNIGTGWTVAYAATGLYTVTFRHKFGYRLATRAALIQASRTQYVEVASCDPATGVMVIHGMTSGGTTLAALTAAAGTRVDFEVTFSDALQV